MVALKAPPTPRPKILDPILVEVATVMRDEKIIPKILQDLEREEARAALPATIEKLREVAHNPKQNVEALAQREIDTALAKRGKLQDPQSSIQAAEPAESATSKAAKALPQAKPRYAMTAPEAAAAVIDHLT